MLVKYSSNNSGGYWWLSDADWEKLSKAGWKCTDHDGNTLARNKAEGRRWLGALAVEATKEFKARSEESAIKKAIADWEDITGMDASAEGCHCCGQPHNFYVED